MRKTATRRTKKHTKAPSYPTARALAVMAAPLWCLPAVAVNVDWAHGTLMGNLAAVGLIACAALLAHAALCASTRARAALYGSLALVFAMGNTSLAFTNLSHATNAARDQATATIKSDHRISSQSSRILAARAAAIEVSGEKPSATLRAEIDALKVANARRWKTTNGCDPAATTARASMTLCARLATLKGQLEAALKLDALDAQLETLNREAAAAVTPASPDAFAENTADLLAAIGIVLSREAKTALPAQRDLLRAVLLEIAAMLGPAAWLGLFSAASAAPQGHQLRQVAKDSQGVANDEPSPFERFAADRLQPSPGKFLPSGEAWEAWLSWCRARELDPGSPRSFWLRLGARFRHDPNNGRPRYRNVSLRYESAAVVPIRERAKPIAISRSLHCKKSARSGTLDSGAR